jgi:hypothetical protein
MGEMVRKVDRMTKLDDIHEEQMQVLRELDAVRERIRRRVGTLPDSSEDIERLREERLDQLDPMR